MRFFLFAFCTMIAFSSCSPKIEKRLTEQMVESPSTQDEKDKNLILQYGIDNKLDLQMAPSGLFYVMEKEGTGDLSPNKQSMITAHYHGTLLDGKVFDSSVERGSPFEFTLGRVIKGWQEGIPLLKKGGKGKFFIPSEMAYGSRGAGKDIPPNSVLIFDIELIDFMSPEEKTAQLQAKEAQSITNYITEKGLDAQKTESGLYYVVVKEGEGDETPTRNSKITAHYHGTLLNGTIFDSSVDRGEPFVFQLGRVIPGWQEGIGLMKKGGKAKLIIPSHLGYGARGAGGKIPPFSVLIFDVELIDF